MSRKIDLGKPLTDEEHQYLVDRCRWDDLAEAGRATGPVPRDPNSTPSAVDAPLLSHPADVGTQNAELPTTPLPTDSVPVEADPDDEGDNYDDTEVWSYSDLQHEAKGRDADIKTTGPREELVARLRKDDSAT